MIQAVVKQHTGGKLAGKWDIYIHDGSEAGDLLVFSNQGYENRDDAERQLERIFNGVVSQGAGWPSTPETVDLLVKRADGTGSHRMLR